MPLKPAEFAGVVLCGGKSSRMGFPKAWLPCGEETMLVRTVRTLREVAAEIIVVAAPGQELPPLPSAVIIARDEREGRGPLEGIAAGLRSLPPHAQAAYITSCDVPLLSVAFISFLRDALGEEETIAVPVADGFHHPLAAVYRRSVLTVVERLLAADQLRPMFLFDQVATRRVTVEELQRVDPDLAALRNCNHPEDYLAICQQMGWEVPAVVQQRMGLPNLP